MINQHVRHKIIKSNARERGRARPTDTKPPLKLYSETNGEPQGGEIAQSELQILKPHWDSIEWDGRDDSGQDIEGDQESVAMIQERYYGGLT